MERLRFCRRVKSLMNFYPNSEFVGSPGKAGTRKHGFHITLQWWNNGTVKKFKIS